MGTKKRACMEVSKIMGASPKNVVSDVKMMGLKRFFPAMTKASSREIPLALLLFTESTRTSRVVHDDARKCHNPHDRD